MPFYFAGVPPALQLDIRNAPMRVKCRLACLDVIADVPDGAIVAGVNRSLSVTLLAPDVL